MKSKAEVRERFAAQIEALTAAQTALGQSLTGQAQRQWPELDLADWEGKLSDWEGMAAAFSRDEHKDDVVAAITDREDPGAVGDLGASGLQGDFLACLERAFRSRHQTRVRLALHAAARRKGHGHAAGIFKRGILGYVEGLLQKTKG